jgi:hypothetical protein
VDFVRSIFNCTGCSFEWYIAHLVDWHFKLELEAELRCKSLWDGRPKFMSIGVYLSIQTEDMMYVFSVAILSNYKPCNMPRK